MVLAVDFIINKFTLKTGLIFRTDGIFFLIVWGEYLDQSSTEVWLIDATLCDWIMND